MDGDQKFLLASLAVLSLAALVTLLFAQSNGVGVNLDAANNPNSTLRLASTSTSKASAIIFQAASQPTQVFNMSLVGGVAKGTFLLSNSKVRINIGGSVVKSLTLNLKTSGIRVNFSVSNSTQMPAAYASPSRPVYQFIQINGSLSTNPSIGIDPFLANVTYNFTVPTWWVQSQGGDASSIMLLKYVPSAQAWNPLHTSLTGSNSTAYFYSTTSNSISAYAVSYNSFNAIAPVASNIIVLSTGALIPTPNIVTLRAESLASTSFLNGTVRISGVNTTYTHPRVLDMQIGATTYINITSSFPYPIFISSSFFKAVNANPNMSSIRIYQLYNQTQIGLRNYTTSLGPSIALPTVVKAPVWVDVGTRPILIQQGVNHFKITGRINPNTVYEWSFAFSTAYLTNPSLLVNGTRLSANLLRYTNASTLRALGLPDVIAANALYSYGSLTINAQLANTYNTLKVSRFPIATISIDPVWDGSTQCSNNWAGGACQGSITYSANTVLTNDVNASNTITINSGVVLTTNGYSIYIGGTFSNGGTVSTCQQSNGGAGAQGANDGDPGGSNVNSYAGSGGGGGGMSYSNSCLDSFNKGGNGGSTLAAGGAGCNPGSFGGSCSATAGSTPNPPTMSNPNIISWFNGGFTNYLGGAGGGGGAGGDGGAMCINPQIGGAGGGGACGVYIQANTLSAGVINANGVDGSSGTGGGAGGGGGGGGAIMLVYGPGGYTAGTYNVLPGNVASSSDPPAAGGNGQTIVWQYTTPPVNVVPPFVYALPTVSISAPSNTIVDVGQYESFTATVANGLSPYNGIYKVVNALAVGTITHTQTYNSFTSPNSFTFQIISADTSNSPQKANVIIWDSNTIQNWANSIYSSNFIVYSQMFSTAFYASNSVVLAGNYQVLTANIAGGNALYTYNFLVYNAMGLVANALYTGLSSTTNTFIYQQIYTWGAGTFTANVYITDSASTHMLVSNTLTYTASLPQPAPFPIQTATYNSIATTNSIPITAAVGYATYFWAGAGRTLGRGANTITGNWVVSQNRTSKLGSTTALTFNVVSIGYNSLGGYVGNWISKNTPTTNTINLALTGIAANVIYANGNVFVSNTAGTSLTLTYNSIAANSFAILFITDGGAKPTSFSTNAPNNAVLQNGAQSTFADSILMIVNSLQVGSYSATESSTSSALSIVAYVFRPYSVTLLDTNPSTGTISIQGVQYPNGATINIIGTNAITANPPSGYAFNNWITSGSNIIVDNSASATANLIVKGTATLTANYIYTGPFISTSFTASNAIVDYNQYQTLNSVVFGGVPPYTYNFLVYNAPCCGTLVANALYSNVQSTSNTFSYQQNSLWLTGAFTTCTIVKDSTGSNTVTNNLAYGANALLVSTSFTASNSVIPPGGYQVLNAIVSGGTRSYTYNFLVYNAMGLVANALYTGLSSTTNTFSFIQNPAWGAGTFTANVYITDSASTQMLVSNTLTYTLPSNVATTFVESGLPVGSSWAVYYNNVPGLSQITLPWISSTNSYPINAYLHSCISSNSNIYCVGGTTVSNVNSVYYAPISSTGVGSWLTTNAYPTNIARQSCVSYNNYIYCVAGSSSGLTAVSNVYYAPISSTGVGSWLTTNAYSRAEKYHSCTSYNGYIYCVGGNPTGIQASTDVYYAPISSTGVGVWVLSANTYPFGVFQHSCVSSGNYIYCVGGNLGGTNGETGTVYYAPISSTGVGVWAYNIMTSYPLTIAQQSCVSDGNYIYCIGGFSDFIGAGINSVYYAPISSTGVGSWLSTSTYPLASIGYESCTYYGGYIYCVAGLVSSATNSVYYAPITTNTVTFSTFPSNYAYTVLNILVNSVNYVPNPQIGWLVAGNTITVTFSQQSVATLTATPNPYTLTSNPLLIGQSSTGNTVISNGYSGTTRYVGNVFVYPPASSNIAVGNTINWALPTSNNALTWTVNAYAANALSLTANSVTYWFNAIGNNNIYGAWTFNDFASDANGDSSPSPVPTNTITISSGVNTCTFTANVATIVFGGAAGMVAGTNVPTQNSLLITNTGNINANILLSGLGNGGNWLYSTNTNFGFLYANTVWSASLNTAWGTATQLTQGAVAIGGNGDSKITVFSGSLTNTIYLGLAVPKYQPVATYNQIITIASSC